MILRIVSGSETLRHSYTHTPTCVYKINFKIFFSLSLLYSFFCQWHQTRGVKTKTLDYSLISRQSASLFHS